MSRHASTHPSRGAPSRRARFAASAALLAALPLLHVGCEPAAPPGEAPGEPGGAEVRAAEDAGGRAAEEEIMALEREWLERFRAGDTAWIAERHAEGGRLMAPGAEAAVGRDAVRRGWAEMVRTEGLSLAWEPHEAHVSSSGDMAYVVGTWEMTLPDGAEDRGKYVVVWVREAGQWKIAADIFNSNLPPGGAS